MVLLFLSCKLDPLLGIVPKSLVMATGRITYSTKDLYCSYKAETSFSPA